MYFDGIRKRTFSAFWSSAEVLYSSSQGKTQGLIQTVFIGAVGEEIGCNFRSTFQFTTLELSGMNTFGRGATDKYRTTRKRVRQKSMYFERPMRKSSSKIANMSWSMVCSSDRFSGAGPNISYG